MKRNIKKARVIATGAKIKIEEVGAGIYENIKTGAEYTQSELHIIQPRHMVQIGFHIWRFGLYLFASEYLKYNSWFIVPGVSVDAINGCDRYLDIEVKALFIGFGIRFIWIKRKKTAKNEK